jgi:hypothetical protein
MLQNSTCLVFSNVLKALIGPQTCGTPSDSVTLRCKASGAAAYTGFANLDLATCEGLMGFETF